MRFLIDKGFYKAVDKLDNAGQKAALLAQAQLMRDPSQPGLNVEKLRGGAGNAGFYSARANRDVRLIYNVEGDSLLLCYVDHHGAAYAWADRRKVQVHPTTGAAQIVVSREKVIEVPTYVEVPATPAPADAAETKAEPRRPFAEMSDDDLLKYGVPPEWTDAVRGADLNGAFYALIDDLPEEAAEALLLIADGKTPPVPAVAGEDGVSTDPYQHPDAQRRFRLVASDAEVQRALEGGWEAWTVFLHPDQRAMVNRTYNGPARAMGSAGTGKTVVALHRALALAEVGRNVLLCTFSTPLARSLREKFVQLAGAGEVADRVTVASLDSVGLDAYEAARGSRAEVATPAMVRALVAKAVKDVPGHRFGTAFVYDEFVDVIDAWQIKTLEHYLQVRRLGRRRQVGARQREVLWQIFVKVRESLERGGLSTLSGVFALATDMAETWRVGDGVDDVVTHVVVDEAQDISVAQLRFLAEFTEGRPDGLFFAGDLGQRIFQSPFSWKELGVDVRGRSTTLKVNYRTSHQIRRAADRLLDGNVSDVDGNRDERDATVSAFSGPEPVVVIVDDAESETARVAEWLKEGVSLGIAAHEVGLFVRGEAQLPRARAAAAAAGLTVAELGDRTAPPEGQVAVGLMHDAKGLEFRAVAVLACDEDVLPDPQRILAAADRAERREVEETERHLLYVACTRSRERLLVTGVRPGSGMLDDLG